MTGPSSALGTGLVARELRLAATGGNFLLPILFFLLVATLFPFAVGPDAPVLARTGGGALWIRDGQPCRVSARGIRLLASAEKVSSKQCGGFAVGFTIDAFRFGSCILNPPAAWPSAVRAPCPSEVLRIGGVEYDLVITRSGEN